MGKITYINDIFKNKIEIEDKQNKLLETLNEERKEAKIEDKKNYLFLINNYENMIKKLSSGYLNNDEFEIFYSKLTYCMSKSEYKGDKLYILLLFYNMFRIYNKKLLSLESSDIYCSISSVMAFIDEFGIENLDKTLDFVFNKNIFNELKELCLDEKELRIRMIDVIDLYLDDIKNPPSCHALFVIEELKNSKTYVDDSIHLITIDSSFEKLKLNVTMLASLFIDSKNEEMIQRGKNMLGKIDMIGFKLKSLSKELQDECCAYMTEVFNNNVPLENKIWLIFDKIDNCYDLNKKL